MENNFLSMEYTLGDVLLVLGYIGGLITVYVMITTRITRLEVRQDSYAENTTDKMSGLKDDVNKNKLDIERDRRYVLEKLAQIESGQSKTNVFLEENLKNLTRIITLHETEISKVREKMDKYDENMALFYRDYDVQRKDSSHDMD